MATQPPIPPTSGNLPIETTDALRIPVRVPEKIGHYHIKRVIASGGMGTVYEATQENPRRVVAVKVMKHGIASKSALRRFEYEAQILARLRHPGVAQIYEAGVHLSPDHEGAEAVPFFAMEYIPNARTLAQFAEEKKLGTRQRLELFAKVCDAVHHGHQKGIIHRDLKPSNILVTTDPAASPLGKGGLGGVGQVKIIDFGVARSTDSDMAITTLQTDVGQLIGTLQYMSPEQCDADPHDIDIRSDVYALGVVLYELLCGKPPYDLTRVAMLEATRVIRDAMPTKLSTMDKSLRGDVETIAFKALEKERSRRYQSAAEFGQDIERYLSGEAIHAHRASIVYQLRLFALRNKAAFTAVATVFVVLVAATIVSAALYVRAESARLHAEQAQAQTHIQWDRAETEAHTAKQVSEFLVKLFQISDPSEAKGRTITAREILDQGAEKIQTELKNQPELQARLMDTMGAVYLNLGLYDSAAPLLRGALENRRRTLGEENAKVADSLNNLAGLLWNKGAYAAAEPLFHEALAMQRKLLGDEHPSVANSLNNLANLLSDKGAYAAAEPLHHEALVMRRKLLGDEHPSVAESLNNLAGLLRDKSDYAAAEPLYREALAMKRKRLGDEHPSVAVSLNNLANLLADKGDYAAAEPLCHEAVAMFRKLLGDAHPSVAASLDNLAVLLRDKGDYAAAEPLHREALAIRRKLLGDEHPNVATSIDNLAILLSDKGDYAAAEPLYREALAMRRKLLGNEHADVATSLNNLANLLTDKGDYAAAEPMHREALVMRRKLLGDEHPSVAESLNNLAGLLRDKSDYAAAEPLYREALAMHRKLLGDEHPNVAHPLVGLAELLIANGSAPDAEPLLEEALKILENALPENHPRIAEANSKLGECFTQQGRFAEAEPMLLEGFERIAAALGLHAKMSIEALERIIQLYEAWDAAEPGKGHAEKAAQWREKLDEMSKRPNVEKSKQEKGGTEGQGETPKSPNAERGGATQPRSDE